MKKIMLVLLSILLCVSLFGCGTDEGQTNEAPVTFTAVITEIKDDNVTVKPIAGLPENSASIMTFNKSTLEDIGACVGDQVIITYEGGIMETYPAQINVTKWRIDESILCAKPVIYLYPDKTTLVDVRLTLDGELTCVYPEYNNGWRVTASPDGTLTDERGQTYNYLYWEGESHAQYDLSQGFCIKGEDTAGFLEEALAALGLDRREANEFIVYWLPLMQNNPYNIISFQTDAYTESAVLDITPAPDTLIRVFMAWQASENYIEMTPQALSAPAREGFVAVEWGGCEVQ